MSFEARLGLLVLLFAVISLAEVALRGRAASRWREYLFVLACGTVGAVFGLANDLLTSRISPEYFILGKGVPEGAGFLEGVIRVGFEAGFSGGAIAGCVLLYANRTGLPPVRHVGWIILLSAAGGLAAWAVGRMASLSPFHTVWGMHVGIYVGLVAGILRYWQYWHRMWSDKKHEEVQRRSWPQSR